MCSAHFRSFDFVSICFTMFSILVGARFQLGLGHQHFRILSKPKRKSKCSCELWNGNRRNGKYHLASHEMYRAIMLIQRLEYCSSAYCYELTLLFRMEHSCSSCLTNSFASTDLLKWNRKETRRKKKNKTEDETHSHSRTHSTLIHMGPAVCHHTLANHSKAKPVRLLWPAAAAAIANKLFQMVISIEKCMK